MKEIVQCPTCGAPCHAEGSGTTHYYEPVLVGALIAARGSLAQARTILNRMGRTEFRRMVLASIAHSSGEIEKALQVAAVERATKNELEGDSLP
jgi:hypothetical protein